VVRAALEAIGYQVRDVLDAVAGQAGLKLAQVRADGGMTANRLLMQFVADMTGLEVSTSDVMELSALGAVLSGALGLGVHQSLDDLEKLDLGSVAYRPGMDEATRRRNYAGWQQAVARVL
jgi:glycerol kinase